MIDFIKSIYLYSIYIVLFNIIIDSSKNAMNKSHRKKIEILFSCEKYNCHQTVKKWRLRDLFEIGSMAFTAVSMWCKFAGKYKKLFRLGQSKYNKTRQKLNLVFFVN